MTDKPTPEQRDEAHRLEADLPLNAAERPSIFETLIALIVARDAAREAITFLRDDWHPYSSRACPACLYENGKFIRRCKVHEALDTAIRERDEARDALEDVRLSYEDWKPGDWVGPDWRERAEKAEADLAICRQAVGLASTLADLVVSNPEDPIVWMQEVVAQVNAARAAETRRLDWLLTNSGVADWFDNNTRERIDRAIAKESERTDR